MTVSKSGSEESGRRSLRIEATILGNSRMLGILVALLAALFWIIFDSGRLREDVFDLYQRLIPRDVDQAFPAMIVEIDEDSIAV